MARDRDHARRWLTAARAQYRDVDRGGPGSARAATGGRGGRRSRRCTLGNWIRPRRSPGSPAARSARAGDRELRRLRHPGVRSSARCPSSRPSCAAACHSRRSWRSGSRLRSTSPSMLIITAGIIGVPFAVAKTNVGFRDWPVRGRRHLGPARLPGRRPSTDAAERSRAARLRHWRRPLLARGPRQHPHGAALAGPGARPGRCSCNASFPIAWIVSLFSDDAGACHSDWP